MNNSNNYRNAADYIPRPFALIDVNAEPGSHTRIVASFDTTEEAQAEARFLGDRGVAVEVEEVEPPPDFEPAESFGPFPSFDGTTPSFATHAIDHAIEELESAYIAIDIGGIVETRIERGPIMTPIACDDASVIRRLFSSLGVPAELLALSPRETSHIERGRRIHEAFAASLIVPRESFPLPTVEEVQAAALVRDGYRSTSNKYRHVARLPEGKTGLEALRDCAPEEYARIMEQAERQAADRYRRFYAEAAGDQETLTVDELKAFRSAGGESSF